MWDGENLSFFIHIYIRHLSSEWEATRIEALNWIATLLNRHRTEVIMTSSFNSLLICLSDHIQLQGLVQYRKLLTWLATWMFPCILSLIIVELIVWPHVWAVMTLFFTFLLDQVLSFLSDIFETLLKALSDPSDEVSSCTRSRYVPKCSF